jgi:hypothetical protein
MAISETSSEANIALKKREPTSYLVTSTWLAQEPHRSSSIEPYGKRALCAVQQHVADVPCWNGRKLEDPVESDVNITHSMQRQAEGLCVISVGFGARS